MRVTERKYLDQYSGSFGNPIPALIEKYDFSETKGGFEYLTKSSAVFSLNIEGNSVDLNSYMNYELSKEKFKPGKEIEEIENLINAYVFAQKSKLTEEKLLYCHKIFSESLLIKRKRGKSGIAYLAIEPEFVAQEMGSFFKEVDKLLNNELSEKEVFY